MLLSVKDLAELFPNKQGVEDEIWIHEVCDQASVLQGRGLFVPLENSGELSEAIANGAVAVIWDKNTQLPRYTPNHFPVFYTDNLGLAVTTILEHYIEKLNGEIDKNMSITNFKISDKKLLKKNRQTYDIAVMHNVITEQQENNERRRG
ncbi:hypothetical protein [Neobacillus muris]|uniref:hypothetical protein n=1 Tax=Neobacillus muris TaxID=2941334 RepID=UPI0020426048|nr:hypothetical protein [Neobacillus muris]